MRTPKAKPVCETLFPWLRSNLGKGCLAALTGTDAKALRAAVQIVELWTYCRNKDVEQAFGHVVAQMQESTQWLAFHAIAHVSDWSFRAELWQAAGLPGSAIAHARECSFGPGGPCIDLAKPQPRTV